MNHNPKGINGYTKNPRCVSQWDMVEAAARELYRSGKKVFTFEDIVVKVFLMYPETFSMKEYPKYPDSNKVSSAILRKEKGLITKGRLIRLRPRLYTVPNKESEPCLQPSQSPNETTSSSSAGCPET